MKLRNGFAVIGVLLFAGTCLLAGCKDERESRKEGGADLHAEESLGKAVTRAELIGVLETKDFDRTIQVMNRIKATQYQGDLLPLLVKIWRNDVADLSRLDKAFIEHPRVRLEIADVLLQASRNGKAADTEPDAYVAYARKYVALQDMDLAEQAIVVLMIANESQDVPMLENILIDGNMALYRITAIAMVRNCAVNKDVVDRVANAIKRQEVRDYLYQEWNDAQGERQRSCRLQQ